MNRRWTHLLALLFAFALIAVSCGGDDDDGGSDSSETTAAPEDDGGEDDSAGGEDGNGGDGGEGEDGGTNVTLPPDQEAEPVPGGTLRVGLEAETDGLDPTTNRFAVAGYQMGNAVYDNLAVPTADGEPVPFLAESFTPSDDLLMWDVKLREGITFHDGTPLNAAAVVANVESQLADPLVSLATRAIFPEDDSATFFEEVDDLTVRFHMRRPSANFPSFLTSQLGMVASAEWLAATKENEALKQNPVGTGPFVFDSREPDNVTRFVRNDDWWASEFVDGPYLDAIEFYPITDSEVAAGNLIAGDLDSTGTTNVDAILAIEDDGSFNLRQEDLGEESFAMMNTSKAPLDDIRVRQALTFATPRQDYIDFVGQGKLRAADQMFTPEHPYYNPDVVQEGDVPDQAQPLIEEYCAEVPDSCTDGKVNIELQYSGPSVIQDRIADILTDGWEPYFNVTRDVLLQDDHITQVAIAQYDIVTWRQFGAENPDVDMVWLSCESITDAISLNWPKYCDETRDELLIQQRALTRGEPEAVEAWQSIVQAMNEAYTYIFFTHTNWTNAFAPNVKGLCNAVSPEGVELYCTLNGRHLHQTIWIEQ